MKIWVTGSSGFLGTRLSTALTSIGHTVVGISQRESSLGGISVSIDLSSPNAGLRLRESAEKFGPPEVVIHAASRQPGPYQLSEYIQSNVLATAHLVEALAQFPPRQFIYTSSLNVYGRPECCPIKESHPINGELPYAATKWWGEQLVEMLDADTQVTVLRLPSLYGVGQKDSFIDGLASLAIKNKPIELFDRGKIARDSLHVDDVVSGILNCVAHPPQPAFCCLNLGCGERITTHEYVESLVEALGSDSPIIPVDKPSRQPYDLYADISQARRQISFSPSELKESMKRYANELQTQS